jgi:hypothetical protein
VLVKLLQKIKLIETMVLLKKYHHLKGIIRCSQELVPIEELKKTMEMKMMEKHLDNQKKLES